MNHACILEKDTTGNIFALDLWARNDMGLAETKDGGIRWYHCTDSQAQAAPAERNGRSIVSVDIQGGHLGNVSGNERMAT